MQLLHWVIAGGVLLLFMRRAAMPAYDPSQGPRHGSWLKVLAALRTILGAALALLAFRALLDATAGTADAMRWTATIAAGGAMLVIVLNALAGVWLLSPFVGADIGAEIDAAGSLGTIRGYGWSSIRVTTHTGWTAHLLFLSVALRPLIVHRQEGPQLVELKLPRDRWSDDELRYAHQLAVLSPYRDPSLPVRVSRRARNATVRFGLARRASRERAQRHLELSLARHRERSTAAPHARREPH